MNRPPTIEQTRVTLGFLKILVHTDDDGDGQIKQQKQNNKVNDI